jgi:hypothetical protein
LQNQAGDFVVSLIQRKMTGVEQMDLSFGEITFESLGTSAVAGDATAYSSRPRRWELANSRAHRLRPWRWRAG